MKRWKLTLLTSASSVLLAGSAFAADLPTKTAPMAAPIPYMNWTGPYIGGHIGVGSSDASCAPGGPAYADCAGMFYNSTLRGHDTNFLAGVQAGYDFQDRYFVYGVVGDWSWTNLKSNAVGQSGSVSYESKVNWLASFRGRAGIALDNTLIYATGGVALGNFGETTMLGKTNSYNVTTTQVGWVAGLGVEHRFTRNWSVNFEYLHYDLGNSTKSYTNDSESYTHTFTHVVDTGRIGLNYRF